MLKSLLLLLLFSAVCQFSIASTIAPETAVLKVNIVPTAAATVKHAKWQKIKLAILQKKWLSYYHKKDGESTSRKTLSTIALISAIAGLALLFIPGVMGAGLLFALAAVITGIIALKKNKDKSSRRKAIIAIVLGALPVVLFAIIVILFAANGFAFE